MPNKMKSMAALSLALFASTVLAELPSANSCTDGRMTATSYNQINSDMTPDAVSAVLGCQPTTTTTDKDPVGRTRVQATWQSVNTSITATFVNGLIISRQRFATFDYGPATYSAVTDMLSIPVLSIGAQTYLNAAVKLDKNGVWTLQAISDDSGKSLPVTPSTNLAVVSGAALLNAFAGLTANSLMLLSNGSVWQVDANCKVDVAKPVCTTSGTTQICTSPPEPKVSIFLITSLVNNVASTKHVLNLSGYPDSCVVTPVISSGS